jgi:hypothetical protein
MFRGVNKRMLETTSSQERRIAKMREAVIIFQSKLAMASKTADACIIQTAVLQY